MSFGSQDQPTAVRRDSAVPAVHSLDVAYDNYVTHHALRSQGSLHSQGSESLLDDNNVKNKLKNAIERHLKHEQVKCKNLLHDLEDENNDDNARKNLIKRLPFMLPIRARSGPVMMLYKVWIRFLVAYSSCLCIMLLLGWFSGFLMEIFFSIFVPDVTENGEATYTLQNHAATTYIAFFVLPLGIVFTAFLGDELCDLVLDSVQQVPLTMCRASLLAGVTPRNQIHAKGEPSPTAGHTSRSSQFSGEEINPMDMEEPVDPAEMENSKEPIPKWMYVALEICMVICLNVVPGCCALNRYLITYQVGPSFRAFIAGSAYGVLTIAVFFLLADVRIALNHKREKLRDVINEQLRLKRVFPSTLSLWRVRESINDHWGYHKYEWALADQERANLVLRRGLVDKKLTRGQFEKLTSSLSMTVWAQRHPLFLCAWVTGAIGSILLWIVTVCFARHALSSLEGGSASHGIFFGCAAILALICSLLSWGIRDTMPGVVGSPFFAILAFFMLVSVVILCSGIQHLSAPDISPLMTVEQNTTFKPSCGIQGNEDSCDVHHPWNGSEHLARYPVCDMAWGATTATLSSLDLAGLASISYATKQEEIQKLLHQTYDFSGRHGYHTPNYGTPTSIKPSDYDKVPRVLEVHFPSKVPNAAGTRVFVIKGTSTPMDAVTDASFFAGIEVLQFFDKIFPVLTVFPEWRIQWLLRPSFNQHTEDIEQDIFEEVEGRINKSKDDHPTDHIVLTGHSLGGGIAQIVAARMGIPALVWSAPGIRFSSHRFAKNVQHPWNEVNKFGELAKRSVTVVIPDHDPVPRVDEQIGMVQQVECRGRHGHLLYPWECHPIKKTACEIWRVCGDPHGRDLRPACTGAPERFVSPNGMGEPYSGEDAHESNPLVRKSVTGIVGVLVTCIILFVVYYKQQQDDYQTDYQKRRESVHN